MNFFLEIYYKYIMHQHISGGWEPDDIGEKIVLRLDTSEYFNSLKKLSPVEMNKQLHRKFWDLEAWINHPYLHETRILQLKEFQKRVLKRLPKEEQLALKLERQAMRNTQKKLFTKDEIETKKNLWGAHKRWENFTKENDPEQTNKAFLYYLDGKEYQNVLDEQMKLLKLPPKERKMEMAWLKIIKKQAATDARKINRKEYKRKTKKK